MILPMVLIGLLIKLTSKGPVIHWSQRVGLYNSIFLMPKFRSMEIDAPQVATHLLKDDKNHITTLGSFLRKTSIDELPQLWSVLNGNMSIVGPRPALFNQYDLIELRTLKNIHTLKPGITGWAQINGRDELSISQKVDLDKYYLDNRSLKLDVVIIFRTFFNVVSRKNIQH